MRLEEAWEYVNPSMLYMKHLGLKANVTKLLEAKDEKALKLVDLVTTLQDTCLARGWMSARAVWKFFPAAGHGNHLVIYDADGTTEIERFGFPRQPGGERLCLADFAAERNGTGRARDYVAMFVTTCGIGLREIVHKLKADGDYLKCHALQALAIESAEGFAELLHRKLRAMWGFPDSAELGMRERFQAKYRGVRVSFGYPACPSLEDQAKLWRLLEPEAAIGVKLTEGYMMDPEASVSALVFHHPEARYFNAGGGE